MKYSLILFIIINNTLLLADWSLSLEALNGDSWRGLQFSDTPTLQPEISFSRDWLTVIAWGSLDLTDDNERKMQFNRTELTIQADKSFSKLWLTGGLSHFTFPGSTIESTTECFLGLQYDHFLEPSAQFYYDLDQVNGWYGQVGIFPTLPVLQNRFSSGLVAGLMLGGGSSQFTTHYFQGGHGGHSEDNGHGNMPPNTIASDSSGIFQYMLSLEYPIRSFSGQFNLSTTYLEYLDDQVRSPNFEEDKRFWNVGVSYRFTF